MIALPIGNQTPVFHGANREIGQRHLVHFGKSVLDSKVFAEGVERFDSHIETKVAIFNAVRSGEHLMDEIVSVVSLFRLEIGHNERHQVGGHRCGGFRKRGGRVTIGRTSG